MKWATMMVALLGLVLSTSGALAQTSPKQVVRAKTAEAKRLAATDGGVAQVIVLHALNDGKGIDPKIGKMPQLKQPPFSAYNSYRLIKRGRVALEKGKDGTMDLPNKGKVVLQLKSVAKAKKGKRFVVATRIDRPNGSKFFGGQFKARPGKIFFVAGERHGKGILVVGIRLSAK